ncbi:DUF4142 domain-containing protein [Sphingobacterium griseoflavum]|uniref:DUF4142 domain-containing protein n=1 Tax=Sphingobacterium griseoflavum TaxID=1474952 RepID=A0ABQ3HZF2_9SPHI|nr:DUF4142 domain-containing protein [Sphingobacterium griseoflavum]GHE35399.1 hypothetical protein GCM10017764_18350 [Sphingobacterium griseoflavum]
MRKYLIFCISVLGTLGIAGSTATAQIDTVTKATIDQDFVNNVISLNRFEIALASQAMERSSSQDIKQFAQKIVTAHTRTMDELEQAAAAKKLVLPDAIAENQADILKSMGELSGADFDSAFKDVMVKSHQDAIALFELGSGESGIHDPELRTWAGEQIPALKSHLEIAKGLQPTAPESVAEALSVL